MNNWTLWKIVIVEQEVWKLILGICIVDSLKKALITIDAEYIYRQVRGYNQDEIHRYRNNCPAKGHDLQVELEHEYALPQWRVQQFSGRWNRRQKLSRRQLHNCTRRQDRRWGRALRIELSECSESQVYSLRFSAIISYQVIPGNSPEHYISVHITTI